jgi:hypothetical protein
VSLIDLIVELVTLDPWLYRGWAYLTSSRYRRARHDAWNRFGRVYAATDIALSLAVVVVELAAVGLMAYWLIGVVRGTT